LILNTKLSKSGNDNLHNFGERGYTDDTSAVLNFRQDGLQPNEALNNADSYAAFIYMLCAFERGMS
jgi:hypothetical protein